MAADGVQHAIAFVTSAYSSYLELPAVPGGHRAGQGGGRAGRPADGQDLRQYFNHPGFVELVCRRRAGAPQSRCRCPCGATSDLVFTAHSIPRGDGRGQRARPAARTRPSSPRRRAGGRPGSGAATLAAGLPEPQRPAVGALARPRHQRLPGRAGRGRARRAVVVVPVGFVSDHMEVVFDLDVEAAQTRRAAGPAAGAGGDTGTDPRFVAMITELVSERQDGLPPPGARRAGADPRRAAAAGAAARAAARPGVSA